MFLLRLARLTAFNDPTELFTFQYVSIKTKSIIVPFISVEEFTFQYVSIKTMLEQVPNTLDKHLHSNMFLLRLSKNLTRRSR